VIVAMDGSLQTMAWLLVGIPLAISAMLLLLGKIADKWGHWLGVAGLVVPFGLAVALFVELLGPCPPLAICSPGFQAHLFTWLQPGAFKVDASLWIDHLSIAFALLVTGVGSLIFVYAVAYMAHDPGRRRFFGFLNLFAGSMLLLVMADNYALLFVGWEGVGLASYLLIGFWQQRRSAALAAKKAFLMNRIGDLGLIAAMAALLSQTGSLRFADAATGLTAPMAGLIGCLLLLAACGKSAQVPLQGWLTDAMEGPTPVSALIHAATMVTAGVYLVVRSQAIFQLSAVATWAVAIVGVVTLLVGAWIGTAQDDIKKVLAGSTMSQIGYMMLAAGLGPAGAAFAIFHLLTHGAFKANLFLGAGAVMHGMDDDTDMRHFGALRRTMPWTFLSFACGMLAIIGFPLTSGYYSKDHIITAAFDRSPVLGGLALLGAVVTAFYMMRLVMLVFFGDKRWEDGVTAHEAPRLMIWPMLLLAVASLVAGAVINGHIVDWLSPVTGAPDETAGSLFSFTWVTGAALLAMAVGLCLGWLVYRRGPLAETNLLWRAGRAGLGADTVADGAVIAAAGTARAAQFVDQYLVDGGARGVMRLAAGLSATLRGWQNGKVRSYGMIMTGGVLLILVAVVVVWQVI